MIGANAALMMGKPLLKNGLANPTAYDLSGRLKRGTPLRVRTGEIQFNWLEQAVSLNV